MHAPLSLPARGFTLIEALIAMFVAAIGILAIVLVQLRTLADARTSLHHAQAIQLIQDFSERLYADPNAPAHIADYVFSFESGNGAGDAPPCISAPCSNADFAQFNRTAWQGAVKAGLGDSAFADVFLAVNDAHGAQQLGILVGWPQDERKGVSAGQLQSVDAVTAAGGGTDAHSCPVGATCQLQYVAVPARCAPYTAGATPQFFCAGAINPPTAGPGG